MIGKNEFFFSNFLEDISPFCGATDTPVSDSGDVCPRFQSQSVFPCLCALLPGCKGNLRFTSGATLADLLVASMAAKPFQSTYL